MNILRNLGAFYNDICLHRGVAWLAKYDNDLDDPDETEES